NFSLGLTEVIPFPEGKQLFVAFRPNMIEEHAIESRSGFVIEIPDVTVEGTNKIDNILDLTNGVILPTDATLWAHKLPFNHNNNGAWVPSPKGDKLAWMVHENPKNLETDLRKTINNI